MISKKLHTRHRFQLRSLDSRPCEKPLGIPHQRLAEATRKPRCICKIVLSLMAISLAGTLGCHCCERTRVPSPHYDPPCPCLDRVPNKPVGCQECYGYYPTCWSAWPKCCRQCPPPVEHCPISNRSVHDAMPDGNGGSYPQGLEAIPVPEDIEPTPNAQPMPPQPANPAPGNQETQPGSAEPQAFPPPMTSATEQDTEPVSPEQTAGTLGDQMTLHALRLSMEKTRQESVVQNHEPHMDHRVLACSGDVPLKAITECLVPEETDMAISVFESTAPEKQGIAVSALESAAADEEGVAVSADPDATSATAESPTENPAGLAHSS